MSEAVITSVKLTATKNRIHILDEVRGFAIVCMVVYHMLYSLAYVFGYASAEKLLLFFMPIEPVFAALFIFISGICTVLSRSNLKRGLILAAIALGINTFTVIFIPSLSILFGILNLLSFCMIFSGLLDKLPKHIPPAAGLVLSIAMFIFTWGIRCGHFGLFYKPIIKLPYSLYQTNILFPLGFHNTEFFSSDYFPILPWSFVFFAGAFFAKIMSEKRLPQGIYKSRVPFLSQVGKRSLIIYILHQPIIFALVCCIQFLFKNLR